MSNPERAPLLDQAAFLRRRCRLAATNHRRRAKAEGVRLDYGLHELESLARSAVLCCYCRAPLSFADLAFDHATPTSRGGKHCLANVVVCCEPDNLAKGQLTCEEYLALLRLLDGMHPIARQDVLRRLRAGGRRYQSRRPRR